MDFKGVKMEQMYEGYKKLKSSEIYKNFERNKKLFDGKSSEVFYNSVLSRVKLEYMGVIDSNNKYYEFVIYLVQSLSYMLNLLLIVNQL